QKAQQLSPLNKNYAELVQDIKQYRAGSTMARVRREPIKSDTIAEPTRTTTSRMLGGESGPVAINDGRTVDSSGALPAIDDVVNKYMQAIGGAAAVNAVTSRVVKGTVDIVGVSRGGTFETYMVRPNKSVSIIKPGGAELDVRSNADFYSIINLKTNYAKLTLVGKSRIGYREVYVID